SGVDYPEVGESLREVSEERAAERIDLLGEEAKVVGEAQADLEHLLGLLESAAALVQILRRPKAAQTEGAIALRCPLRVAVEQCRACSQGYANPFVGTPHELRVCGFELVKCQREQT